MKTYQHVDALVRFQYLQYNNNRIFTWLQQVCKYQIDPTIRDEMSLEQQVNYWFRFVIKTVDNTRAASRSPLQSVSRALLKSLVQCLLDRILREIVTPGGLSYIDESPSSIPTFKGSTIAFAKGMFLKEIDLSNIRQIEQGFLWVRKYSPHHPLICHVSSKYVHGLILEWEGFSKDFKSLTEKLELWRSKVLSSINQFHSASQSERHSSLFDIITVSQNGKGPMHSETGPRVKEFRPVTTKETFFSYIISSIDTMNSPQNDDCTNGQTSGSANTHETGPKGWQPEVAENVMRYVTYPLQVLTDVTNISMHRIFLQQLKLAEHLSLLKQVYLFGNGNFVFQLTNALFFDDKSCMYINNHRSRRSWPPLSLKVNTALRNVMAQSINSNYLKAHQNSVGEREFLGDLGFLVTDEEAGTNETIQVTGNDSSSFCMYLRHQMSMLSVSSNSTFGP